MKRSIIVFIACLILAFVVSGQGNKPSGNPNDAKLVTSDITNFWRTYDLAKSETEIEKQTAIYQREYFDQASPGLQDFIRLRLKDAASVAKTVQANRKYYESARASTLRIGEMEKGIRTSFSMLKNLYPEAVFPDVYFLIGKMSTGGTTSGRALLIGAEIYARTPQAPENELSDWHKMVLRPVEDLPSIVAHELIHFQQKYPLNIKTTLLKQTINEGAADFLCELICGANSNPHLHTYGNPREQELWNEFKREMNEAKLDKWLYGGNNNKDRPADLGYYLGYKITEAYYNRAKDKSQAIREILTIKNFEQFLKDSGYENKFDK